MKGGAVVTGAGRGLGRAIAHELARRGYRVLVTDVDGAAAEAVATEIGETATAQQLDVTDPVACQAAADAAAPLDVWVNNAGIAVTGPSWTFDHDARRRIFDINTHGTMNGTVAALEHMRRGHRGHVINIVSLAGLVAPPAESLYGATKHAALGWSVGTHHDLRLQGYKNIHVCAVCPDGIWTPMLYELADDANAWPSWSGVMLTPEHVAQRALTLLDRPQPVLSVPRRRGAFVRLIAAFPRFAGAFMWLIVRDARRKQRAWARRHPQPGGR